MSRENYVKDFFRQGAPILEGTTNGVYQRCTFVNYEVMTLFNIGSIHTIQSTYFKNLWKDLQLRLVTMFSYINFTDFKYRQLRIICYKVHLSLLTDTILDLIV